MIKRLSFLLFFLVLGTLNLVQGAPKIHSLTLTSPSLLQCGGNVIEGKYTPVAVDTSGAIINSFDATQYFLTSNSGVLVLSESFTSGSSHTFYLSIGSGTM